MFARRPRFFGRLHKRHAPGRLHKRRTRRPRGDNQWGAEAFWSGSRIVRGLCAPHSVVVGVHQRLLGDFCRPARHAMHAPWSTLVAGAVLLWASYARGVVGGPTGRRLYPPEEDSPVTRCLARNRYLCGHAPSLPSEVRAATELQPAALRALCSKLEDGKMTYFAGDSLTLQVHNELVCLCGRGSHSSTSHLNFFVGWFQQRVTRSVGHNSS